MNGSGNLGSAIGTIVFPWLVERLGWDPALQVSASAAIASGLIWMFIDSSRQIDIVQPAAEVLISN